MEFDVKVFGIVCTTKEAAGSIIMREAERVKHSSDRAGTDKKGV